MRQVKRKPILSYFFSDEERKRNIRHFPFLFRQSHKFHPLSLTLFMALCLLVGGTYSLLSLAAGLSLLVTLTLLFIHTRASARNLYVSRRVLGKTYFQNEKVKVDLSVVNTSVGPSACFKVKDCFSACEDENIEFSFAEGIAAKTKVRRSYEKTCDGGVGVKKMGPLKIEVTDFFGIFHFEVIEDEHHEIEVLPKIGSLPEAPLKGSLISGVYGSYEVDQRGYSVNFQGVREFVHGDSLRHVAWKITARNNEIMVKEFDRMVNSQVYVAVNDHPTLHIGKKKQSTWETARSVGLSLVSQQLEQGNGVEYIGGEFSYNLSAPLSTFEVLAKKLTNYEVAEQYYDPFTVDRAKEHFHNLYLKIKPSSTLYYITPYVDSLADPLVETMAALKLNQIKPIVVLIDINSYLSTFSDFIDFKQSLYIPPAVDLNLTTQRLQANEIEVILLHAEVSAMQSFLYFNMEAS